MKKFLAVLLILLLAFTFVGCGGGEKEEGVEVYFLNFKPEVESVYASIAEDYAAETGNTLKVVTAASGTYEQTLKSEIAKSEAPVIFQLNGPVGYEAWKDYCMDLSGTEFYNMLADKNMAIKEGEGVYGIPYAVEGYGIIYNKAIMDKYFALEGAVATGMEDINNFASLKAVVEDMTVRKEALGIEGVFASTSLASGNQWRWQTHLANIPLFYEFSDMQGYDNTVMAGLDASTIGFTYNQNFKNIFDLYINNSCTAKTLIAAKTVDDSMAEFALGKCAMVQNGNWGWGQISGVAGNTVAEEDVMFLPIYTGVDGEEAQGLCVGTENYFAINSKATEEQQAAALNFLEWLFGSDTGKAYVIGELGFIAPFTTFGEEEKPTDPLAKNVLAWIEKEGIESVAWTFAAFPSEQFKNDFGDALLEYAQGSQDWNYVVNVVKTSWESEYAAAHK